MTLVLNKGKFVCGRDICPVNTLHGARIFLLKAVIDPCLGTAEPG